MDEQQVSEIQLEATLDVFKELLQCYAHSECAYIAPGPTYQDDIQSVVYRVCLFQRRYVEALSREEGRAQAGMNQEQFDMYKNMDIEEQNQVGLQVQEELGVYAHPLLTPPAICPICKFSYFVDGSTIYQHPTYQADACPMSGKKFKMKQPQFKEID